MDFFRSLFALFLIIFPQQWTNNLFTVAMSTYAHPSARSGRIWRHNDNRAAVVFLHGLGDTADGWSSLEQTLPLICPRLGSDSITYVFPQAPIIGITVNGGVRIPGWFDIFDWPIDITSRDDVVGQIKAVRTLEDTVDKLEREEGIPPSRVVVGGFAMGGAVAMLAAYNRRNRGKEPFAGCICLSGWLPMRQHFSVNPKVAELTPLFWAHGQYDDKILYEQQVFGIRKLMDRGVDITARVYPVGHESFDSQEIEDMAEFLDSILFPQVELESWHPQLATSHSRNDPAEFLASLTYLFDQHADQLGP